MIEYGCNELSAPYHTDALLPSPEGFLLILYKGRIVQGEDVAPMEVRIEMFTMAFPLPDKVACVGIAPEACSQIPSNGYAR